MPTPQGIVRVCQANGAATFQVVGWGKMDMGLPIRRYAEQALASGVRCLKFELQDCTYIDSTFLGTLLILKRVANKSQAEFFLVAPSDDCRKLLHQLGVLEVFPCTAAEATLDRGWTELARTEDVHAFNHNVVQAHRELAELGGVCGEKFEPVARCLEKELKPGDR